MSITPEPGRQGVSNAVRLSMPRAGDAPERFEVNVASCELDPADAPGPIDVVELTHYRDDRYSLVILTATEARDLARLLTAAAGEAESRSGGAEAETRSGEAARG
jgi:hypothetical protein